MSNNENTLRLFQRKARLEIQTQVLGDIIRGLTSAQTDFVKHVEIKGQHRFNAEATILLEVTQRCDVLPLLTLFPVQGLSSVTLRDGGRAILTTATPMGSVEFSRISVLPFLYTLVQVRKRVRHSVVWTSTLADYIKVAIECDILHDRAAFDLEHVDDVAHNQVLFRRRPNEWLPAGLLCEQRGVEWSTVKDVPASATVWWPHDFYEARELAHTLHLQEGRPVSVVTYASTALEVRQEAHAHATTK